MGSETNQYPMSFRCGEYYVYFTSKCLIEAFHVHAGKDKKQKGSAKFYVMSDGSSTIEKTGRLSKKTLTTLQKYIKSNHKKIYQSWIEHNGTPGYYVGKKK